MTRIEATRAVLTGAFRRWVADESWLRGLLTARRWMTRAYFEARYMIPDPWRLATSPYERERAQVSMRMLSDRRYAHALEVGCGEGSFTARLLERCDHVVALDFCEPALRRARRRFAGDPRVEVRRLDVRLEDPPQTFDLVFCAELFYYLNGAEFADVASRMVRWVTPGGDLCLVHGTSRHDAGPGHADGGIGAPLSARAIHDRFGRMPDLLVLRDLPLPRYRLTLLRRREARHG
jgi:SAM-dependent methyltransferase